MTLISDFVLVQGRSRNCCFGKGLRYINVVLYSCSKLLGYDRTEANHLGSFKGDFRFIPKLERINSAPF